MIRKLKNEWSNNERKQDSVFDVGKVQPQAIEAEQAVLGGIIEFNAFDVANDIIGNEECFYVESHKIIYRAIKNLSSNQRPIDIITIAEALKTTNELEDIGGMYGITKLTNYVNIALSLETHARIVMQKYIKRKLIEFGSIMINNGFNDTIDCFDAQDEADKNIASISDLFTKSNYVNAAYLAKVCGDNYTNILHKKEKLTGVPSGFIDLDITTNGWQPTDLIILAARPSVGKTAFALNLAKNAALKNFGVGFFSLEMSKEQLVNRIISDISQVDLRKISRATTDDFETEEVYKAFEKFSKLNIQVDDLPGINIHQFRSKARRMVNKQKVGLIIVDYLQLMSGENGNKGGNREQEISTISRSLKTLAKELKVPIIALSQMSRAIEARKGETNRKPQLSDLRESGAIEQDADMVMFLYRDDYGLTEIEKQGNVGEMLSTTYLRIAKHRNGTLEEIKFESVLRTQTFKDFNSYLQLNKATMPSTGTWRPIINEGKKNGSFDEGFNNDAPF